MHRKIALVGVLLVLLSLVPAVTGLAHDADDHWDLVDADGAFTGLPSGIPTPADGESYVYDSGYTWFFYRAEAHYTQGQSPPAIQGLSHATLSLCTDEDGDSLSGQVLQWNGSTWTNYGSASVGDDGSTNYYGLKWTPTTSIEKDDAENYLFVLRVEGEPGVDFGIDTETGWVIKAGQDNFEGSDTFGWVTGPQTSACGFVPEPSGLISVAKSGNDICVGPGLSQGVYWELTLDYSTENLPEGATVTAVINDTQLGIEDVQIDGLPANPDGVITLTNEDIPALLETDVDATGSEGEPGTYSNTVSVVLYYDGDELATAEPATGYITVYHPELSVIIEAVDGDGDPIVDPVVQGTTVYWKYTVTNTGDLTAADVTITVDGEDVHTFSESLAPGDPALSWTDPTGTVLTDLGTYTHTATVTGEPFADISECDPIGEGSVTVNVEPPPDYGVDVELSVEAGCDGTGYYHWSVWVQNTSDETIDITVAFSRDFDPITFNDVEPNGTRDAAVGTDTGSGVMSLTATATGPQGASDIDSESSANLQCEEPPDYGVDVELSVEAGCDGAGYYHWSVWVQNTSDETIDITVAFSRDFDPITFNDVEPNGTRDAAVGTDTGSGVMSLTASATGPQGASDIDSESSADLQCEEPPGCELADNGVGVSVNASASRVDRGDTVDFTYVVTNNSGVTLYNVQVYVNGDFHHTITMLENGDSDTFAENVVVTGTTTRTVEAIGYDDPEAEGCSTDGSGSDTVRVRTAPPPPSYGVDVSLEGSADCETGFTWVATVTNQSDSAVTVNVDFDRDGIADQTVSLGAGASQQLTRTEEGTGNKDLSVTATIAGRSESDSASASAGVECIPPPPPEQPPEVCVPVIKVHVMDESEAGIGGALVKMGDFSTTTAADGWASFPGLPAGTYQLNVVASGYVPGKGSVTLEEGACEVTTHVTVRPPTFPPPPPPPPTGNITGNICLLEGLDAVEVRLQNGQTALVQSGGSYSFAGLPAGTYTVSASSNLGADSQTVSIGGESPLDAVVDFCFQAAPAQAPLPRTGGPLWPSYAGGMVLLAVGMVLRRRIG